MVSISTNLKYFLIVIITFCIVYWWQSVDVVRIKKKNTTNIYDKIKLPLLVSSIIGCILLWNNNYFNDVVNNSSIDFHNNSSNNLISINNNKEIAPNFFNDLKIQPENNIIGLKPSIISSNQPEVYTDFLEW